ncbi:DUF362 domain-containing protein [Iamia sp. SCSIO 61187]|uniref:DUF362 domain-containing protein n=1 Tax=Iamia sp. SCSIO 61187 TaxID=2722752 RepID=UPI001C62B95F|nr:DUF362 domain-containing protein [Iamia sp. SCSIO 61187]QYG92351.1 DUF362 domain-containing protein [Iamia sp. SCSIO 61187]
MGDLIATGESVLLKPNLVKAEHPRFGRAHNVTMTHGSVIRAVADYVFKAVGPEGEIIVADAPQTDSSWTTILEDTGLAAIERFYRDRGLRFRYLDLRNEEWISEGGAVVERRRLSGDPAGGVRFDLGSQSEFVGHRGEGSYYGADYDSREVNRHHSGGRHEYLIAKTVMQADVVFSLPKLKSHKKAGMTGALKNLVGVNGDKNWLPHHTEGPSARGGDESPDRGVLHRVERAGAAVLRRLATVAPRGGVRLLQMSRRGGESVFGGAAETIRSGNWWGNDTVWRMCLDLNKVLVYGDDAGGLRTASRRRHFVLFDGIIAGEAAGPLDPDPVELGAVIFGTNAPSADAAACCLLGFDPDLVPIVARSFSVRHLPLAHHPWRDVEVVSNLFDGELRLGAASEHIRTSVAPHYAWAGHIELQASHQPT